MKLLCLSQDDSLVRQIEQEASSQNWSSRRVSDRDQVTAAVDEYDPDMLLVDVENLDDLQWWQDQGLSDRKPVLFLNQAMTEDFIVRAFECGADGLVPKTLFSRRFLAARVNAYLRRQGLIGHRRFVPRLSLVLDSQRYRVEVRGQQLVLTLTEYKILRALATDQESIVGRIEIQNQVFGSAQLSKRSLDVHICSLRKKLRPYKLDISSVRGVGYGLKPCTN